MDRVLALRVGPRVRLFALAGLLTSGSIQLNWTPAEPWAPVATIWGKAADVAFKTLGEARDRAQYGNMWVE